MLFIRRHWKDTREQAASLQVLRRCRAVISDAAAHFKTAGDLLRMVTLQSAARWKIRRTAEHEIKALLRAQYTRPEISLADFVAFVQPVPTRRLAGKPHAFGLRLDSDEARTRQAPRRNHPHGANATAKIEHGAGA